ncbi:MAG: F0F1 ATP synthase subunit A [Hyphomicrobiales bacterium]|nr:F0F1 ATP synthase subunit A [Hyphomicrobiales bacterium]
MRLFGHDVSFTNSALLMVLTLAVAVALLLPAVRRPAGTPGRLQALGEIAYEFVAGMVRQAGGEHAMGFFPFVFSIFMFILVANLLGLVPMSFSVTAHIVVTAALALTVFLTVIVAGLVHNGFGFFKLFVPSGVSPVMKAIVAPIEIISFFSRPLSHSVRLFANMLAGHITLNVFAAFVAMMLGAGVWSVLSPLPLAMTIGLFALELLVAFLQAYVFTLLTCMYLNDALHPGH